MEQKNKKNLILTIIAIVLIGGGIYYFSYYKDSSVKDLEEMKEDVAIPPPAPVIQTSFKNFKILSIENGVYKARDDASNKEINLFIPETASFVEGSVKSIKIGSRIEVQKSVEASNGLLVMQLSVSSK